MVGVRDRAKVTVWWLPATAVARPLCTATSTAPTASGVVPRRLDRVIRGELPAMLLCTTIRIVWLAKFGPPMVMLGPQVASRGAASGAATAEAAPVASVVATAMAASRDLVVTGCSTRHVVVAGGR